MPAFLLIGIPIVVAVLLFGIMSLPDEELDGEKKEIETPKKPTAKKKRKKTS